MQTVAELIKELKRYRSDAPVTLVMKDKEGNLHYAPAISADVHTVDDGQKHPKTPDGVGVFITSTEEY